MARYIVLILLLIVAQAQSRAADKRVAGEFAIVGGAVFGTGLPSTGLEPRTGNRAMFGGSAGVAFTKRWVALFEYSRIHLGSYDEHYRIRGFEFNGTRRSRANDFGLAVHFNLSAAGRRVVPYAVAGGGGTVWSSQFSGLSTFQPPIGPPKTEQTAGKENIKTNTFSFGAGLRWYLTDRLGLRPEVRWFSTSSIYGSTARESFLRTSVAILYRTHPRRN